MKGAIAVILNLFGLKIVLIIVALVFFFIMFLIRELKNGRKRKNKGKHQAAV